MTKCPLPWTGIAVEPNGDVKNCAISSLRLGSLKYSSTKSILNNYLNKKIRSTMCSGEWPQACRQCERVEAIDPLFSNRSYQLNLHKDADRKSTRLNSSHT